MIDAFALAWFMLGASAVVFLFAVVDIIRTAVFLYRIRQVRIAELEDIERNEGGY